MPAPQYFDYSPFTRILSEKSLYSQAVRIGDRIECSGQGGWDPTTGAIPSSLAAEIEQAFANVDACLRAAGGEGWPQVYKVNLYTTELSEEAFTAWAASMQKWAGESHRPLLTGVAVAGLGVPGMRVEVEVVAYVGEGAETKSG